MSRALLPVRSGSPGWATHPVVAALLLATVLHLLWAWLLANNGGDIAAQDAWAEFARDHPGSAYNLAWYGGMHPVSYSILSPYLMALAGVRTTILVAGPLSAALLALVLVRSRSIERPAVAGAVRRRRDHRQRGLRTRDVRARHVVRPRCRGGDRRVAVALALRRAAAPPAARRPDRDAGDAGHRVEPGRGTVPRHRRCRPLAPRAACGGARARGPAGGGGGVLGAVLPVRGPAADGPGLDGPPRRPGCPRRAPGSRDRGCWCGSGPPCTSPWCC